MFHVKASFFDWMSCKNSVRNEVRELLNKLDIQSMGPDEMHPVSAEGAG